MNGYFKLYISTFKGRLGERMLRPHALRARRHRLLRFPLRSSAASRPPKIATMVKDEVEAARRLHRRRLRAAGLSRQPGGHRDGVHSDAELHARPDRRGDRRCARSC